MSVRLGLYGSVSCSATTPANWYFARGLAEVRIGLAEAGVTTAYQGSLGEYAKGWRDLSLPGIRSRDACSGRAISGKPCKPPLATSYSWGA
jgi:hypothetical protein